MNINWKARLTNKTFWVAIVSAIVLLTQQLGLNIFPSNWEDILNTVLTIFIILGIVVDTSTTGISDEVVTDIVETVGKSEKIQTTVANPATDDTLAASSQDNVIENNSETTMLY